MALKDNIYLGQFLLVEFVSYFKLIFEIKHLLVNQQIIEFIIKTGNEMNNSKETTW